MTTFTGRLPARFSDRAPRVERRDGVDYWIFEDRSAPLLTTDAHQSWDASQWCVAPVNSERWEVECFATGHIVTRELTTVTDLDHC